MVASLDDRGAGVLDPFLRGATLPSMNRRPQPRRPPTPWRFERIHGGWAVLDASDRQPAYVYGSDQRYRVRDDRLTLDEGRRVAANIARLPSLLVPGRG